MEDLVQFDGELMPVDMVMEVTGLTYDEIASFNEIIHVELEYPDPY